jgi:hypothetical protein
MIVLGCIRKNNKKHKILSKIHQKQQMLGTANNSPTTATSAATTTQTNEPTTRNTS